MLSLKLPQLLRVHQVPRVRDSPAPTSQGAGWVEVLLFVQVRKSLPQASSYPCHFGVGLLFSKEQGL